MNAGRLSGKLVFAISCVWVGELESGLTGDEGCDLECEAFEAGLDILDRRAIDPDADRKRDSSSLCEAQSKSIALHSQESGNRAEEQVKRDQSSA